MAHTRIRLGDRSLPMHDTEILITAHWLLRHAEAHPDRFPEADYPYLEDWRELLEPYVAGALNLGLRGRIASADDRDRFGALAASAREALLRQPDEIAGEVLNALLDAPDLFTFESRSRAKIGSPATPRHLAGAARTLIEPERKAFGIDDQDKGGSEIDQLLQKIHAERTGS